VARGKVTRSWRYRSSEGTIPSALIAEPTVVGWAMNLFFVRVNQVLVRLWARATGLPVRCGVVGFPATDRGGLTTGPVVRLMSDRESVSGVSKPRFGFSQFWVFDAGHAPLNRAARVQRRVCELIWIVFHSPQGVEKNPGSVPKMIEIRVERLTVGPWPLLKSGD